MKTCPTCQTEYADDVEFCSRDGMKLRSIREVGEDPMIGRALDQRWIIESKLGEGGMGAVYIARQRSVNRKVAIKTLRPQLADNDEFVDRFFREAKVATMINHPHCVTILDFGQDAEDSTLYLAMEFLEGEALADRMSRGAIPLKDILRVGAQVTSALAAAHGHSIVHRDLKPDNIYMLDIPGGGVFAKVLDFGIAKVNTDGATQYTRTGQVFGTPEYMSPEQCSGHEVDGRSDLYALGCILYEMVIGKTPFKAPSSNAMAVLMAHLHETPAPPSAQGVSLPAEVEALIMRLLAKEPDARAESAASLNQELEALLAAIEGDLAPSLSGAMAATAATAATAFDATAAHSITPGPSPAPIARLPTAATLPQPGLATLESTTTSGTRRGVAPLIALGVVVALAIAGASAFALSIANQSDEQDAVANGGDTKEEGDSTLASPDEATPTDNVEGGAVGPSNAEPPSVDEDVEATPPAAPDVEVAATPEPAEAKTPTKKVKSSSKKKRPTRGETPRRLDDVFDKTTTIARDADSIRRNAEKTVDAADLLLDSLGGGAKPPTKKKKKKKAKDAMDVIGF